MRLREIGAPDAARIAKREGQHKYDHGHVLVLGGPPAQGGAARLAARAALRVGAGLVTLACPPAALAENGARLDAVMLRALEGTEDLERLLADRRLSALCLGPGFGLGDRERDLVAVALDAGRPTVLDADALTLVARERMLRQRLHPGCVLTPHAGEFRRLFPGTLEDEASRAEAVRATSAETGAVILLKGAETLVAGPEGLAVHAATGARGAPWLATAGAGDVLAGLIAGLLARGLGGQEAAEAGAWLHVEAARIVGPGLIAEDLPEALPAVFRALGL
ncbi:YjeF family protein [Cereibacter sphaeroides WS8N]|uniref:NAD(P)H-hydrate dehydratase n=1 Tax=Cereibacter sphaeroides TaxID=1063 RepID=UPI00020DF217|nr:NAD(P)H-hydrate dehydratase [Cereibacter sphaeroides]EGJ21593.1 YjeF family protein [Cereibacter sphaeroides WS8N]